MYKRFDHRPLHALTQQIFTEIFSQIYLQITSGQ